MLAVIRHGEGALAIVRLQQTDPAAGTGQSASNFSSREWERVMLDLVVTHWFRFVYALIGGRAGLKADDARRAAEAKAAEDARRAAEAKAAEDARRAAEAKAFVEARRGAKAKPAEDARRTAEAKAAKEPRGGAKAKAAKEPRREAKAAEDVSRVAKSKAGKGARSAATTPPSKEEMAAPPADLRLTEGVVAKLRTRPVSQKRTPPRMRAR
jgi:hypothetical protein